MRAYIIRRLIQGLVVLILLTGLVFIVVHLLPGDPVLIYMSQEQFSVATAEQLAAARHEFGLDRPIFIQYLNWVSDMLHGDMGRSIIGSQKVSKSVLRSLPVSLYLGIITFIISNAIAIPMGIICAVRRGKWIDTVLTVLANIGVTAPVFWVGILLIYIFGLWLHWIPVFGFTSPLDDFGLSIRRIIMPVFCLCLYPLSATVRQTRSAMLEVTRQDYIRTAWSKGLKEHVVILKHALKNGMFPVVTLAGLSIGQIVGGQVLIETVFAIPGMGRLAVDALLSRDYAVVQGVILVVALAVVLCNILVDFSYSWLDPRVRYE